jgi:hypothetical protein
MIETTRGLRKHLGGDRPIQTLNGALDYALPRELRLGAAQLRQLIWDLRRLLVGRSALKEFRVDCLPNNRDARRFC